MGKKTRDLQPKQHVVMISDPRLDDLTAEAWSYLHPKTREIYVRVQTEGRHVVTLSVRVPR